jgi:NADPH:quinone reductase-like Zn-dependent oxidoreductase
MNPGGRHVSIAFLRGNDAAIDIFQMMRKRLRLSGSTMKIRSMEEKASLAAALRREVWPLFAGGRLKPVTDTVFPLAAAPEAHRRMEAGLHLGKIVLRTA